MKYASIVIGAGWSGLACAVQLAKNQHHITLIEAAPQPGGRARGIQLEHEYIDNGQHILIGAYTSTIKLLDFLGIKEEKVFLKKRLELLLQASYLVKMKLPRLPAPWHFVVGLFLSTGLTISEKISIFVFCIKLVKRQFKFFPDCTLQKAFFLLNHPAELFRRFWEPIALATMSTPIDTASANVFFKVLQDSFNYSSYHSDYLFPKVSLNTLFIDPAIRYLQSKSCCMMFGSRIKKIIFKKNRCIGVEYKNDIKYADQVVLAIPPWAASHLLIHPLLWSLSKQLEQFTYEIITTVYLVFEIPPNLPSAMLCLLNGPGQWIFDRTFAKQEKIISVVITGDLYKIESKANLAKLVYAQLRQNFSKLPKLQLFKVIREKKAAFSCTPWQQILRPHNTTPISNLFLVGDYTNTGYPATLEGAIRSGLLCAKYVQRYCF